ncbi:O-antigen ligase family protein [Marinobacterium sediminicola]|uniref:O-antigen ligase n=1 Tax=Marinobacterium sediminicola TaxID=518898 RepID=A0ABY1S193_9GAMM|nr:O-antigen ligase family protein [Marinobacterium sediminicola]ULG68376.1 O-antigen ligase family protein [Marinobacterium sediminicola]SMR74745.1 O-antigen ligase [Marinobacterium sediminicola]
MRQTRSLLENSLIFGTLALLVWLPLPMGSNRVWAGALFCLVAAALTIGWGLLQLQKHESHNRALKPALPLLGLLLLTQLWVLLQWLLGLTTDVGRTLYYLMLGLGYSCLFILVVGLFHTRRRLTLLVSVLVISATLQAFYGTFMTLSGIEWLLFEPKVHNRGVVTGTFVNRNHLAGYMVMALGCGIGLLMALRDGSPLRWRSLLDMLMGPKARLRLALVIMVIALVMTRSRMGNTAFFAALLIIGGLFILLNKEHRLRNGLILASLIVIDVLVISQFFGLEQLKDRLVTTQIEDRIEDGVVVQQKNVVRTDVFAYALQQLEDRPLTGFGAGAFESSFQQYPGPELRGHYDHTHNDYLQFLIEYGLIGTLPLAAFVLLALNHALRALWHRQSWYRSGLGFGVSMALLGLLIHSFADFNLQIPANAATFVVICAIGLQARYHRKTKHRN